MVQQLLMWIKNLESQVSWLDDRVCQVHLTPLVISYAMPVSSLMNSVPNVRAQDVSELHL